MSRRSTGTLVKTRDGRFQPMVTLCDGSRMRLKPLPLGTSEAEARARATYYAEQVKTLGLVRAEKYAPRLARTGDDAERWVELWLRQRHSRGFSSVKDSEAHWRNHLRQQLGHCHPCEWQEADFRGVVRTLDEKVVAAQISWATARNIWSTARKMAKDAATSKDDAIRCRRDNPAENVPGPDRGPVRGKQFLYPNEVSAFLDCESVSVVWRRIVALGVYLYLRSGELRALECQDVDLKHGTISVSKALGPAGCVKPTKGLRRRYVPIEQPAIPLLEALLLEAGNKGFLVREFPSERDMARGLRRWLVCAGVTRRELHERSPTTVPITFHDLRATGITWMAVRGDSPLRIQHRAGHSEFATTQRYVRAAEFPTAFGDVFPKLPAGLCTGTPNLQAKEVPWFWDPDTSCVYAVAANGRVKIGFSAELSQRLKVLASMNAAPLQLLAAARGGRRLERWIHGVLESERLHGEWFSLSKKTLAVLEAMGRASDASGRDVALLISKALQQDLSVRQMPR